MRRCPVSELPLGARVPPLQPSLLAARIAQASHAAPKLGRYIRLLTRNKVVGSLGPDGRVKFLSAIGVVLPGSGRSDT
jgi:hypothetical protein